MNAKLLSLKLDIIFKIFFIRHPDLLKSFVSALLDIPRDHIYKFSITNPELPPESATAKEVRFDIALLINAYAVDIELQVKNYQDFKDRELFYWSKLFTSMLKSGEKYGMLKATIAVGILDFMQYPEYPDYQIDIVTVIKDTDIRYSSKMLIRFFELPKLSLKDDDLSKRDLKYLWLCLFKAKSIEDLDMLRETQQPDIVAACDTLQELSEDQKLYDQWSREIALHDMASITSDAYENGYKLGSENVLNKLRMLGFSDQLIDEIMHIPDSDT